MKKLLVAVAALVGVAVAASVGSAGTARTAASSASAVSCGTTRTIGFLVPATGPAASIGQQQVRWEKFVVNQWNKTHKTAKIVVSQQDTQLGAANGSAQALAGAQALASNSKVLAVVGAAGSNENKGIRATLKGAGFGWVTGSATADELTTPAAGTRGYFFRAVPNRQPAGHDGRQPIIDKLKAKSLHHRRPGDLLQGLADTVQNNLKAAGQVRRPRLGQPARPRTSRSTDREDRQQHVQSSTSRGSCRRRPRPSVSSSRRPARARSSSARTVCLDPSTFKIAGSYDSFFPVNPKPTASRRTRRRTAVTATSSAPRPESRRRCDASRRRRPARTARSPARRSARTSPRRRSRGAVDPRLTVHVHGETGDLKGGEFGLYQIQPTARTADRLSTAHRQYCERPTSGGPLAFVRGLPCALETYRGPDSPGCLHPRSSSRGRCTKKGWNLFFT